VGAPQDAPGETPALGTIVVVAVEALLAQALAALVGGRFTVIATAVTLDEAECVLEQHRPCLSVVVLDPPFRGATLGETCTRLIERHPSTRTLLLFRQAREHDLMVACQLGAQGMFDMSIAPAELLRALERLAGGELAIQTVIFRDLMNGRTTTATDHDGRLLLTATQVRALNLLAEGHSSKEIARLMNITTASVNHTLERASQRLGARHRAQAVAQALRLGLLA
jgi:DNA-binding NarL/FixJ family response regulator